MTGIYRNAVAPKRGGNSRWQGARYSGRIALAGEQPTGKYPCRQFHSKLRDKANNIAAGRQEPHRQWGRSASAKWQEVL